MQNMPAVVVVGSCMMDFVCYTSRLPKEGETMHANKFVVNFGGKGANQCVAAQKLAVETAMIARVGDDTWGQQYLQNFLDNGIDHSFVKKTPGYSNGIAQIVVAKSGANQIIIVSGANSQLSVNDIYDAKGLIESASVIVCQLETSAVALEAIKLCKGISILNGAPGLEKYDPELLRKPSIFCVNETEASMFAGIPVETLEDAKLAINLFLEKGCKCVIITMGKQGAIFATREETTPVHIPAEQIDPVDTTGAGDAFIGSLACLLMKYKKLSLKSAIEAACFIATDCCKRPGTQPSYPDVQVLNDYLKRTVGYF